MAHPLNSATHTKLVQVDVRCIGQNWTRICRLHSCTLGQNTAQSSRLKLAAPPANRRLQLTAFGARDRRFFEALLCRAPRRQLKRRPLGCTFKACARTEAAFSIRIDLPISYLSVYLLPHINTFAKIEVARIRLLSYRWVSCK